MHQPFHVDHLRYVNGRNDLGGNKIKISRSKSIVKAKNLHSMWCVANSRPRTTHVACTQLHTTLRDCAKL